MNKIFFGLADNEGRFCNQIQFPALALADSDLLLESLGKANEGDLNFRIVEGQIIKEFCESLRNLGKHKDGERFSKHSDARTGLELLKPINSDLKLIRFVLHFASGLKRVGNRDYLYFELFNVLFGLYNIKIDNVKSSMLTELDIMINSEAKKQKKTSKKISEACRKRRLVQVLEAQINDIHLQLESLSHLEHNSSMIIETELSAEMLNNEFHQTSFDEFDKSSDLSKSMNEYIDKNYIEYERVFFVFLLKTFQRHYSIEELFTRAIEKCGSKPHLLRHGDQTCFNLLQIYSSVKVRKAISSDFVFDLCEISSDIMRWALGQYYINPVTLEEITDIGVLCDFNNQLFSQVSLVNLADKLRFKSQHLEALLLLYQSHTKLDYAATLANSCGEMLANNTDGCLAITSNSGVPASIIDKAISSYYLKKGQYPDSVSYMLKAKDYEQALSLFLKYEVPQLVRSNKNSIAKELIENFSQASLSFFKFDSHRRVVELLNTYLKMLEYYSPDQSGVDLTDLRSFVREIFAKVSSVSSFAKQELTLVRYIVNDVLDKVLTWNVDNGMETPENILDTEMLNMLGSNDNLIRILKLDWPSSSFIINKGCRQVISEGHRVA